MFVGVAVTQGQHGVVGFLFAFRHQRLESQAVICQYVTVSVLTEKTNIILKGFSGAFSDPVTVNYEGQHLYPVKTSCCR